MEFLRTQFENHIDTPSWNMRQSNPPWLSWNLENVICILLYEENTYAKCIKNVKGPKNDVAQKYSLVLL